MKPLSPSAEYPSMPTPRDIARFVEQHGVRLFERQARSPFDDLALVAARVAQMQIAVIRSLGDSRQWFESNHGIDAEGCIREATFFAQLIREPERPLQVRDARLDARFADDPMVRGSPGIRFFCALPLIDAEQRLLGALCVMDFVPGELDRTQLGALVALARLAVALIAAGRQIRPRGVRPQPALPPQAALPQQSTQPQQSALPPPAEQPLPPIGLPAPLQGSPAATDNEPASTDIRFRARRRTGLVGEQSIARLRGVLIREPFEQRLAQEIHRADRYRTSLSLLIIDIDHFRQYNAEFGRSTGDQALQVVADALHLGRSSGIIGRYGGDGFAIILPETIPDAAYTLAERLRQAVARAPVPYRPLTISVGASTLAPGRTDPSVLLMKADCALSAAKKGGRNRAIHAATIPFSTYLSTDPARDYELA